MKKDEEEGEEEEKPSNLQNVCRLVHQPESLRDYNKQKPSAVKVCTGSMSKK